MPITMYQASIPVFQRMLGNLSGILSKAANYFDFVTLLYLTSAH